MTVTAPPAADPELAALVAAYGTGWDITRHVDHGGAPGAFHAVRRDPRPALQGLRAPTAAQLHAAIECAEAMPR